MHEAALDVFVILPAEQALHLRLLLDEHALLSYVPALHVLHVVHCMFEVDVQLAVLYSPAAQVTEHDWHSRFWYSVQALDSYWS